MGFPNVKPPADAHPANLRIRLNRLEGEAVDLFGQLPQTGVLGVEPAVDLTTKRGVVATAFLPIQGRRGKRFTGSGSKIDGDIGGNDPSRNDVIGPGAFQGEAIDIADVVDFAPEGHVVPARSKSIACAKVDKGARRDRDAIVQRGRHPAGVRDARIDRQAVERQSPVGVDIQRARGDPDRTSPDAAQSHARSGYAR
ncbi:hypothetical protein LTR94_028202, partial [Friedmanniomyces endolithicus]